MRESHRRNVVKPIEAANCGLDLVRHIRSDLARAAGEVTEEVSQVFDELADRLALLIPNEASCKASADPVLRWLPIALASTQPHHRPMMQSVVNVAPYLNWTTPYESAASSDELDNFRANYTYAPVATPPSELHTAGPLMCSDRRELALFVTVQGPGCVYPAHQHPAVEIYGVVAGTAQWLRGGEGFRPRRPGDVFLHTTRMMHATTTTAEPTVSWVAWLDHFETAPTLTC